MRKFFQKLTFFKTLHHLLVVKALLLPILLFLPHKTHAVGPLIAGLMGLLGSGLKGIAEGTVEAGASLITLALSVGILSYIAFSLAKFLLWLAATVFNWSMETMVFGFSTIFGDSGGMLLAWSTLRDIGNIVLLFGFLYIGIQMILNVAHFNAKQTLPRLLIAAILINFSLFISGAIIDITNGISSTFDSEQVGADSCQGTGEGDEAGCRLNNGIAGQILGQLNIISVVSGVSGVGAENIDVVGDAATYFSNPISSTITFIALAILVMLAAVVLFAGAFLIIARGITLAFLLVVSPIGFVGMAIEPLHGISQRWWKALIDNALFAPIFIILLFVGLRLTDSLKDSVQVEGGLVTALTSGDGLMAGPVFLFMLVIGFMVAALTFARSAGVIGSEAVVKFATSVGTSATSFPFLPARKFISERSEKYGKAYERSVAPLIRKLPVFGKDIETVVGAGVGKTFDAGKNVSLVGWGTKPAWDEAVKKRGAHLRHVEHEAHIAHEFDEAVAAYGSDPGKMRKFLADNQLKDVRGLINQKNVGVVAKAMGGDAFKKFMNDPEFEPALQKTAAIERKKAKQEELDSALRANASGNPDGLLKFMKKLEAYDAPGLAQFERGGPELQQMMRIMPVDAFKKFSDDSNIPDALRKEGDKARKTFFQNNLSSAISEARNGNRNKLEKLIQETDDYDLARLEQSVASGPDLEEAARHMSPDKFSRFYNNPNIETPVKERWKAARFREFNDDIPRAAQGDAASQKRIQAKFDSDIIASGVLDDTTKRTQLVRTISDKQYEGLKSSRAVGPDTRQAIEEIRYGTQQGSRFDPNLAKETIGGFGNKKDILRVPAETLAQEHVLEAMNLQHFIELANSGKLNDQEKAPIADYLRRKFEGTKEPLDTEWAIFEAFGKGAAGTKQDRAKYEKLTRFFEL